MCTCKLENEARLPQFLDLTTSISQQVCQTSSIFDPDKSKTKQFCETSSIFEPDSIQNEAVLRDALNFSSWQHQKRSNYARLPSKMESWVQSWRPPTVAFYDFSSPCLWSIAPATKKWCQVIQSPATFPKLKIWCSKLQPLSENFRPDLLTSLISMSLVLRLARKMHACRSSSNVPHVPSFLKKLQNPHVLLTFDKVPNPFHLPRKTASERPKVVRTRGVFNIWTSKGASRHNGASTSQLAKVVRSWCVLYILTWTSASRHNSVNFFDI